MTPTDKILATASLLVLAGCGGSGTPGPVFQPPAPPTATPTPTSTPTPTPTPAPTGTPPVTAVPFDSNVLATSRTFSSDAVRADVDLAASQQTIQRAALNRDAMSIQYNATTGTYVVGFDGAQATFGRADRLPQRFAGEAAYRISGPGGGVQFLTILSVPVISGAFSDVGYNRHVAQGYWQTNQADGQNNQFTRFTSFVFGNQTAGADMPRTGAAHWLVDIFGALSVQGNELRTVSGVGDFVVDFGAGTYLLDSNLTESKFLTIGGSTGSLRFLSGGDLAADGSFSGPLSYTSQLAQVDGTLGGRFFGPGAAEVGATFEASSGTAWLSGAFTGQRSQFAANSAGIPNISLSELLVDSRLFSEGSRLIRRLLEGGAEADVSAGGPLQLQVTAGPTGLVSVSNNRLSYTLSETDRVSDSTGAFDRYRSARPDELWEVAVYRPATGNGTIELTYMNFVRFDTVVSPDPTIAERGSRQTIFYPFGISTLPEVLRAKTGSAAYSGVAYARGAQRGLGEFELAGSSAFTVDFSAGSYNGELLLSGLAQGGFAQDSGQWTFVSNVLGAASITGGMPQSSGTILTQFFGPTGQEIGAPFSIRIGTDPENPLFTEIAGIAVASQPD